MNGTCLYNVLLGQQIIKSTDGPNFLFELMFSHQTSTQDTDKLLFLTIWT